MRGDYEARGGCAEGVAGSPPHAWGLPRASRSPSGVGKVHPHMRGDMAQGGGVEGVIGDVKAQGTT